MSIHALIQLLVPVRPHFLYYSASSILIRSRYAKHILVRPFSLRAAWREVIGIDFGTTNSRVAVMDRDGNPKVIEIDEKRSMPSVVFFDENGKNMVGVHAVPEKTVSGIKKLIGRSYDADDKQLQKLKKMVSYEIIRPDAEEDDEEQAWVKLANGKTYSPTYIASLIIGKLIDETAISRGNIYPSHAVVTVPPSFDDARAFALREAAEHHTPCVDVVDDSVAAALYYMTKSNREGRFAVIDLGGGSFDISIVNASNGRGGPDVKRIATTHGDGVAGVDFDDALMNLLLKRLALETGGERETHVGGLSLYSSLLLRREAEKAKIELSFSSAFQTRIKLSDTCVQEIRLERSEFEESMKELILKVEELCWSCLKEAKMRPKHVDEVILVGGMSRVPRIGQLVEGVFGKAPAKEINPDEAVALGAAIKANLIANKNENLVCYLY